MIEIDITLNIHGCGVIRKDLGRLTITNDGTGTPTRGNYVVRQWTKQHKRTGSRRLLRQARVENWPRRSKHVVKLLAAGLRVLGQE